MRNLLKLVLVVAVFCVPVFAQKTGGIKSEDKSAQKSEISDKVSREYNMGHAEVTGYTSDPYSIFITEKHGEGDEPINLTRSFKDALKENIDRETVDRMLK